LEKLVTHKDKFTSPLTSRYSSEEMSYIFSPENKYLIWRKLWIALAKSEKKCGLEISQDQISQMQEKIKEFDWDKIAEYEKLTRHEVIAHIHGFGDVAPSAKPIIHLGATSAFVMDNGNIVQYTQALELVKKRLVNVINKLAKFAKDTKHIPCLGFTHFQPAQLTTVGKRTCLWLQDLVLDYNDLTYLMNNLPLRGVKGTTGTQASFMKLFNKDEAKIDKLEELVCKEMGFDKSLSVTGQTYTRKIDYQILSILSSLAQSASKFANDMRLLMNLKELEEPFEEKQVGSSAMPYKRNPMRSERINSLSRYVINNALNAAHTQATQWLERTLDDSAIKRIAMEESFLAIDGILRLYDNIASGIVVYENMIKKNIERELPFMATEDIMMEAVKNGGNRQEIHEVIREISHKVTKSVKLEGKNNDLIKKIVNDKRIGLDEKNIKDILSAERFIGRSISQVDNFIVKEIETILKKEKKMLENKITIIKV
jgi:adenylosuccinate lyase